MSARPDPDALPDVDATRLHEEIAARIAYDKALVAAAQHYYVKGEKSPVLYYVGRIERRIA